MGKAFGRLRKTVEGRHSARDRVVPWEARISALEVATLELMHYVCIHMANDPADPHDVGLVEAFNEYKKGLEQVVKGGSNG